MTAGNRVRIDGSAGEGGGQLLRTSLTLSILTGTPCEIVHIRARRARPGLQPQHLQAVLAAQQICGATVEGAILGSQHIRFTPGPPRCGQYRFDIGTAGATSLVLHTVYLPLTRGPEDSTVRITGGTHVPWSPSYNHLVDAWLPCLQAVGITMELTLVRAGFYPHGGGELVARIAPLTVVQPLQLARRGTLHEVRVYSAHTNLTDAVAARQATAARRMLHEAGLDPIIDQVHLASRSRNTVCAVTGVFEHTRVCYSAIGERGKRAERVAEEACQGFLNFLRTDATVDEYLADQIILPLALARGPSVLRTPRITTHLATNIATIGQFLSARIRTTAALGEPGEIEVIPRS